MRTLFIFICIIMLVGAKNTHAATQKDDLTELISVVNQHGILIDSWEVTLKEKMPITTIKQYIENHSQHISVKTDKHKTLYQANSIQKEGLSMSFTGIIPLSSSSEMGELIVVISGNKWNDKVYLQYQNTLSSLFKHYFSENVHNFTCLQGQNSAILKKTILLKRIKQTLKLKHVKTQLDREQIDKEITEIYGYSTLLSKKLMISGRPMNTHISYINEKNGQDKIIIGTPILINEY